MNAGREKVITMKSAINFIFATCNAVETMLFKAVFRKQSLKCADVNPPVNEIVAETNVDLYKNSLV